MGKKHPIPAFSPQTEGRCYIYTCLVTYSRLRKLAFNSIHWHLFLPLAGSCRSGWQHHRAGGRRGRVDLLRWLGGRAGGHPVPRPRPAERPSGRGKHTQSTWPDLDLNPDSHNCTRALHTRHKKKTLMHTCIYTFAHSLQLPRVAAEHSERYTVRL